MIVELFRALGFALSARAQLFLSVLGGFVIALIAAMHDSLSTLYVFIAWSVLTIIPIICLELFRRRD